MSTPNTTVPHHSPLLNRVAAKLTPGLARRVHIAAHDSENHAPSPLPLPAPHQAHLSVPFRARWRRATSQSSGSDNPEPCAHHQAHGEVAKSAPLPRKTAPRSAQPPKRHSDGNSDHSPALGHFRANSTPAHAGVEHGSRVHSEQRDQDGWAVLREVVGGSSHSAHPRPPHRVLMVVVDDSPLSLLAFQKAVECKRPHDELFVCHPTTAPPPSTHAPDGVNLDGASLDDAAQRVCVRYRKLTARLPHAHTLVLCASNPHVEVGRLAEQMGVHTVFVGDANSETGGRLLHCKRRNPPQAYSAACRCDVMFVRERR